MYVSFNNQLLIATIERPLRASSTAQPLKHELMSNIRKLMHEIDV